MRDVVDVRAADAAICEGQARLAVGEGRLVARVEAYILRRVDHASLHLVSPPTGEIIA
jgi:hypothetical protein